MATKSSRGRRGSVDVLLSSPVLCGLSSQFSISSFKTVPVLKKQMRSQRRSEDVRVGRMPGSCRCGLPRAEGRKGAAARGEGLSPVATTKSPSEAARRPSSQRDAASFQRRNAARQAGSCSWCAPVGALSVWLASRTEARWKWYNSHEA